MSDVTPSKFVVPGDEVRVFDVDGKVIQEPRRETPEELAKREPARLRSKAAIERLKSPA